MTSKPTAAALAACFALVALAAPAALAGHNECALNGAQDQTGRRIAPPCIDTRVVIAGPPGVPIAPFDPLAPACGANPSGAPWTSPVSRGTCSRYYVLLLPDYDGDVNTQVQFTDNVIWEESNNCNGLQRIRDWACYRADSVVLV